MMPAAMIDDTLIFDNAGVARHRNAYVAGVYLPEDDMPVI